MDQALLQRALNLVKKTGDRLVIVDPEKGDGLVILSLDEYEVMAAVRQGADAPSGSRIPDIGSEPALTASVKAPMIAPESEQIPPLRSAPMAEERTFMNDGLELEERYYLEPLE